MSVELLLQVGVVLLPLFCLMVDIVVDQYLSLLAMGLVVHLRLLRSCLSGGMLRRDSLGLEGVYRLH